MGRSFANRPICRLVAGNLEARRDVFRTMGNGTFNWKCGTQAVRTSACIDSLKRAMKWDEDNLVVWNMT